MDPRVVASRRSGGSGGNEKDVDSRKHRGESVHWTAERARPEYAGQVQRTPQQGTPFMPQQYPVGAGMHAPGAPYGSWAPHMMPQGAVHGGAGAMYPQVAHAVDAGAHQTPMTGDVVPPTPYYGSPPQPMTGAPVAPGPPGATVIVPGGPNGAKAKISMQIEIDEDCFRAAKQGQQGGYVPYDPNYPFAGAVPPQELLKQFDRPPGTAASVASVASAHMGAGGVVPSGTAGAWRAPTAGAPFLVPRTAGMPYGHPAWVSPVPVPRPEMTSKAVETEGVPLRKVHGSSMWSYMYKNLCMAYTLLPKNSFDCRTLPYKSQQSIAELLRPMEAIVEELLNEVVEREVVPDLVVHVLTCDVLEYEVEKGKRDALAAYVAEPLLDEVVRAMLTENVRDIIADLVAFYIDVERVPSIKDDKEELYHLVIVPIVEELTREIVVKCVTQTADKLLIKRRVEVGTEGAWEEIVHELLTEQVGSFLETHQAVSDAIVDETVETFVEEAATEVLDDLKEDGVQQVLKASVELRADMILAGILARQLFGVETERI